MTMQMCIRDRYKSGPAFQKIEHSEVVAVMSRDISKAKAYAKERGIAKWLSLIHISTTELVS